MSVDKSEPAFPHPSGAQGCDGLTKREWFAGQALAGFCSSPNAQRSTWDDAFVAKCSFEIADAMLLASKETNDA